jgi:hypothetical protein
MLLRWRDAKIFTLWREISKLLGVKRLVSSVSLQAQSATTYMSPISQTNNNRKAIITALLVVKTYIIHTAGLFLFLRKQLLRRLTH